MAKVSNPLFTTFHEAFSNTLVYQRSAHGDTYVRTKVKHPTEPRSAHYDTNVPKWAQAVAQHQADAAPDEALIDYIVDYAIPPNNPTNIQCTQLIDDPTDPIKHQFTIQWDAPTTKWNGWPLNNLAGYIIEFTVDHVTWTRLTASPHTSQEITGSVPDGDVWLTVSAVDANDNLSIPSPSFFLQLTL